ncbi:MAG TPA: glucokinase [Anaerolineae bacterium]
MILAGDIGGTKTVLALFPDEVNMQRPSHEATFSSSNYDSLEAVITDFLKMTDVGGTLSRLRCACFGVAGPVVKNRARITNLPWVIDAAAIGQELDLEVYLLNDLEAIATAVPHLGPADLVTINEGRVDPHGAIAVIAPGTGLGEAFLVWNGRRHRAYPSEGGHASFAPRTEVQRDLLAYLDTRLDHVSFERVCSGKGLPNIYRFLKHSRRYVEPDWLRQELANVADPTPVIVNTALSKKADICVAVLDLFINILGVEAGNMALKLLATGGVYLAGGIPPRILTQLQDGNFMTNFCDKGRFASLLARIPIHVIINPQAALHGAAYHGMEMMHGE